MQAKIQKDKLVEGIIFISVTHNDNQWDSIRLQNKGELIAVRDKINFFLEDNEEEILSKR